ncbi:MAG: hypothetical protein HWN66_01285 [Candidatus Helarchaeota archaeon]|nr:hypothetical protein [Candidatus Helarchaeota archaeon]
MGCCGGFFNIKKYRKEFRCRNKYCAGLLTIPVKLISKGRKIVNVARCPICHASYKYDLPLNEKDQWLSLIRQLFSQCDLCRTDNDIQFISRGSKLKGVFRCKYCGKRRVKVISSHLWDDLMWAKVEKPPFAPPRVVPEITPPPPPPEALPLPAPVVEKAPPDFELVVEEKPRPSEEAIEEISVVTEPLVEQVPSSNETSIEIKAEVEVPAALTKYKEITKCDRETCAGFSLIPQKLTLKRDEAQLITQCLRCPDSYEVLLKLSEKELWLPLIKKGFFQCDRCGTLNDDNYTYSEKLLKVRTVTRCRNCGKKYVKVISNIFWKDLVPAAKKLPIPPLPPLPKVAPPPLPEEGMRPTVYTIPPPPQKVETTFVQQITLESIEEERPPISVTYKKIAYDNYFLCKRCGSSQMAVRKIKAEQPQRVKVGAKCANCGKSKQFSLPFKNIQVWLSYLAPSFFRCAICGSSCQITQTQRSNNTMKVTFYCERDWLEFQKELPLPLFRIVMTQIQKAVH